MNSRGQAFVSIVTPVYNGERYLRDCVDSVLSQTHTNWEYIILNNASTDKTLEIAKEYEGRDRRINVFSNEALLPIIANHNKAFSLISPKSKYCKVVSADDVIFPQCIEKMVALADQHPTIGLVGSYQIRGGDETWSLQNHGLPFYRTMIPGAEVCRDHLLGKVRVFGNPTSVMYRADLVRGTPEFYPNPTSEADTSACFGALEKSDFGFVHQVLSYEREHQIRETTRSAGLNAYLPSRFSDVLNYRKFLSTEDFDGRVKGLLDEYYEFLAKSALELRNAQFWEYHKNRLKELGYQLNSVRLGMAIGKKLVRLSLNPGHAVEMLLRR